jgi:hypothetical protein
MDCCALFEIKYGARVCWSRCGYRIHEGSRAFVVGDSTPAFDIFNIEQPPFTLGACFKQSHVEDVAKPSAFQLAATQSVLSCSQ